MISSTSSYTSLHELCNLPSFTLLLTCTLLFSQVLSPFSIPRLNSAGLNHIRESQVLGAKAFLSGICGHMCPGLSPVSHRQLSPAQFSEDLPFFVSSPTPCKQAKQRGQRQEMYSQVSIPMRKFALLIFLCSLLALLRYPITEPLNWAQSKVFLQDCLYFQ